VIKDNVVECIGLERPLLRSQASYGALIENNQLTNVSDTDKYENKKTTAKAGLEAPLTFTCGVHEEYTINGWEVTKSK
jgi:hypothetical protein